MSPARIVHRSRTLLAALIVAAAACSSDNAAGPPAPTSAAVEGESVSTTTETTAVPDTTSPTTTTATEAGVTAPPQDQPLGLLDPDETDPLVDCGVHPFRLSLLDETPDVDLGTEDPLFAALFDIVIPQPAEPDGWRTLFRDDERAVLARFWDDPVVGLMAGARIFENTDAGWEWVRSLDGRCGLELALPDGVDYMQVGLNPARPMDPASTTLHLVVAQRACASGRSGVERMYPPEVIETDAEIRIAVAVAERPPIGDVSCISNTPAAIRIELDAPIGDRVILDAVQVPPAELTVGIDL